MFNQEKALVGAFSVITNLRMELFEALVATDLQDWHGGVPRPGGVVGALARAGDRQLGLQVRGVAVSRLGVPQIDLSVPQPVVQSRRRPLLGPSPG